MKRRYIIMWSMCTAVYGLLLGTVIALYAHTIVPELSEPTHAEPLSGTYEDGEFITTPQAGQVYKIEPAMPGIETLPLDQQLMSAALRHAPPGTIKSVFDKAAKKYKNDPEGYLRFVTIQDDDGWMPLQHFVVDGDADHVAYILKRVSTFFKNDPERYATFLMLHDKQGLSPLLMSLQEQQFEITEMLLESAEKVFGFDKKAFFEFLNKRERRTRKTALIIAGYNNWLEVVDMLVATAARVLGKNSSYFKRFINATDAYDRTAVTYGNNAVDRILTPYGGQGEIFTGEVD